jgi:hypothetical protein
MNIPGVGQLTGSLSRPESTIRALPAISRYWRLSRSGAAALSVGQVDYDVVNRQIEQCGYRLVSTRRH